MTPEIRDHRLKTMNLLAGTTELPNGGGNENAPTVADAKQAWGWVDDEEDELE